MNLLSRILRFPALSVPAMSFPAQAAAALCDVWHNFIAPAFGARCRFYPSCSQYAAEALRKQGFVRGSTLAVRRVCRCNGLFEGGHDPVPESNSASNAANFNQGVTE